MIARILLAFALLLSAGSVTADGLSITVSPGTYQTMATPGGPIVIGRFVAQTESVEATGTGRLSDAPVGIWTCAGVPCIQPSGTRLVPVPVPGPVLSHPVSLND
jgi:hypothetical protein